MVKKIAFKDIFTKNKSKYNTRNKSIFIPKKCSNTVCQQAISHHGQHIGIAFLLT